jgi:hypothetical protein
MYPERDVNWPVSDQLPEDPPLWHALRPEIRSASLSFNDLKALAARQQLRPDDYVWHPAWHTWRAAGEMPDLFPPSPPLQQPGVGVPDSAHKASLKDRARHELRSYVIISAYILVIISLLRLHQALIADTYHYNIKSQGVAIVTALVLGKVVLLAEALQLGSYLGQRVPALSILIRSALFAGAILCFHAAEEAITTLWEGRTLASAIESVSFDTIKRSCILALIMTIALVPYFLIKEIEKRTGQSNLLLLAVGLKR